MRNFKYVLLKDLEQFYNGRVLLGSSAESSNIALISRMADMTDDSELEVQVLGDFSKLLSIRLSRYYNAGFRNVTLVPKELIRTKMVEEAIDLFTPVLNAMHPDKWFWQDRSLYICYPELTITNSLGLTHKMYDLVVKLDVNPATGNIQPTIYGSKFSFTKTELKHGYVHSHLYTKKYNFSSSFCLGTNTPFANFIVNLNKTNTVEEFEFFLVQLRAYLEWESIEGKPHFSIRKFSEQEETAEGLTNSRLSHYPVTNIASFIISKIKADPSLIYQAGNYFIFDPGVNSAEGYALDREIADTFLVPAQCVQYSESRKAYVQSASHDDYGFTLLPADVTSLGYSALRKSLGIIPRIVVEEQQIIEEETVSRVPVNIWEMLVRKVNEVLLNNLNKNAQRNKVSEERVSVSNEQITGSDTLLAQSMPEGQGMVSAIGVSDHWGQPS